MLLYQYKRTNTDAPPSTKVQILTHLYLGGVPLQLDAPKLLPTINLIMQAAQASGTDKGLGVLTAAVNLMLSEATTGVTQAAGMLAMDGRCKTLDQAADGYVR